MIKILWVELRTFLRIMCVEACTLLYWRCYVEEYVENWLVGDRADEYRMDGLLRTHVPRGAIHLAKIDTN